MALITLLLSLLVVATGAALWALRRPEKTQINSKNSDKIRDINKYASRNEVASALSRLISEDGAGDWPPRCAHHDLPSCFQPYQDIYLELIPNMSTAHPTLDDEANGNRMAEFRGSMSKLLAQRVNIPEVEAALKRFEAGDRSAFTREAYNAVYCCIAVCRHAYRWATIPVVKQAQNEMVLDFPRELDAPWPYLQRHFGLTAESGNNTANVLLNFDESGDRIYKININMSDLIKQAEDVFFRMFLDVEVSGFPIYHEMVLTIVAFEQGRKEASLKHLESITGQLRELLAIFYNNMKDTRISRTVWLSYVQGFQGWGVGRMVNGEFDKFDGLSGNHVLFFQAVDAFLGLGRYLPDENMDRYIPVNQRNLCQAIKKHSIRDKLNDSEDSALKQEFLKIVNHMKVFRAAHRTRARPYLEHPAPERLIMTAGKSVLETPQTKGFEDAYKPLDDMLAQRLEVTV
ncbi:hypothetical protein EKO27_g4999 [Xylaria grammica]|uniref:Indoleamine 2,3-dioxygenase n=1 Tax=Xylaria grammica TaxID=363999 RepID=A0A439D6S6_9PEZI|nr:hypothetical protein EKO27_g4999 [Xylaria grammica]